jgi:hypothetical protein
MDTGGKKAGREQLHVASPELKSCSPVLQVLVEAM